MNNEQKSYLMLTFLGFFVGVALVVLIWLVSLSDAPEPYDASQEAWSEPKLIGEELEDGSLYGPSYGPYPIATAEDEEDPMELQLENIILRNLVSAQKKLIDVLDEESTSDSWAKIGDTFHIPICTSAIGLNYIRCISNECNIGLCRTYRS